MSTLEVHELSFAYGLAKVLHGVDLRVDDGEIVALVGTNGAGKTTLLNVLAGTHRAGDGRIELDGENVTGLSQPALVQRGIVLVPEGREVFSSLAVEDNLRLGAYARRREVDFGPEIERVFEIFPRLQDRSNQRAGTLSGGEQQMLAIGRALMARPKLLLLDEPSLGLAPQLVTLIMHTVARLRDEEGITVLIVEQNARAALKLADRGYLLDTGEVGIEGASHELIADERVMSAYLGRSETGN